MKFDDLYKKFENVSPKRLNVINPLNNSIYEALRDASAKDLIIPVLFGDKNILEKKSAEFDLYNALIVNAQDPDNAAALAVQDINEGRGQLLMKGDISTARFMKPVLNRENGLRAGNVLSHVAVASGDFYHKLIFIADGGININLDLQTRQALTRNTVDFAEKVLRRKPALALAAAIEDVNEKMPETVHARTIADQYSADAYLAEGPVAFDVIFSPEAAAKKNINSRLSGNCDVIIMPNMTTANFMVKQLIAFNNAAVGGIIAGAKVPLVLLSRSDTAATKLNSILLGLL